MRGLLFGILLLLTSSLAAQTEQGFISGATLKAELLEDGPEPTHLSVQITYDLKSLTDSVIQLKALRFDGFELTGFAFRLDDKEPNQTVQLSGNERLLSADIPTGLTAHGQDLQLRLDYKLALVAPESVLDFRLPVIYPDMATVKPREGLFEAEVRLASFYQVYERFPTRTWTASAGHAFTIHKLSLQSIPSMISMKGGTEKKPLLSVLNIVDALVILILVLLLTLGWKKIRQV